MRIKFVLQPFYLVLLEVLYDDLLPRLVLYLKLLLLDPL